ncbi:MAG: peptidylprolyl isomerase [Nitrospinales bacterium]
MIRRISSVLISLFLTFSFLGGDLWAETTSTPPALAPKEVFKINGKIVPDNIASVNGVNVPAQYLENQLITYKIFKRQRGEKVSPQEESKLIKDTVVSLIDLELLSQKSKKLNIKVDPKAVDKQIEKISGQFPSRELFLSALSTQRLTLAMLKSSVENQLMEQEFLRSQVVPKVNVDDAAVTKYYNDNSEMFKKPETLTIYHIFIRTPHSDSEKISDPAMKKRADRLIALIDNDAQKLANSIIIKLGKGEKFEELAKEYSEDDASKEKGGLIGSITSEQTLPEIFQTASKLKTGETSGVVKSTYGYHIVRLTEKHPAKTAELSEVKADILNVLMKIEVQKKKEAMLTEMRKTADIKIFL